MGLRIGWEEARQYLIGQWNREPTDEEIGRYQDYMLQD